MTEPIDPVTTALTGQLSFYLLLAAALTFPIALAILRLYARAVRRSMRSQAHHDQVAATRAADSPGRVPTTATGAGAATLHDLAGSSLHDAGAATLARLLGAPRRAAVVYAVAGGTYGILMAAAQLMAGGLEFLPIRFLFLAWIFSWPIVPTIGIVAATSRRGKVAVTAAYFLGGLAIGSIAMSRSPDLTWGQIFVSWVCNDLPATILLLTFLSRRIRAVGPLILTFMLLALIGSNVLITVAGTQERYLRAVLRATSSIGLGGTGTFFALIAVGFLLFAVVGWAALLWIGRRYQAKKISDESVTVDALWALFAIVHSMDLVFGHPLWSLGGLLAFAAYKTVTRVGFALIGEGKDGSPKAPSLLILRSFSIGSDSERLFNVLGLHWRRVGSIQMIAGIDLASQTMEPHEFLDFVSGRLSRRFIDGEESLDRRMGERDTVADRDRRFRVNEFFCYEDTWKLVLSRLVHESDVVVMDLRGFSRQNAGCVFELHELSRLVPLERVVFVVDRRTDEALLAETLGNGSVGVFRLGSMAGKQIRELMAAIAAATPRAIAG